MNAASIMNTSGNNYAGAYSNNVNQIGAAKAGNALANGQALTQGIGFLTGLF